jgi:hypothetical protein
VDKVWVVTWSGEHEDWPFAIFRDEEDARALEVRLNSTLAVVRETEWAEAVRMWEVLYDE